jgi:hypothetical protein
MISHDYKFVFIHIPKTGGTSIEHSLIECGAKPYNFKFGVEVHYDNISKSMAESYFIFAFHRNPWDRFVSLWRFWMFEKRLKEKFNLPNDFEWFCKNFELIRDEVVPKIEIPHFIQQCEINNQPDYVKPQWFEFDKINESFEQICDKIGLSHKPLSFHNKTDHQHYKSYYNEELKEIVAQRYKKDIEYFKYEF